MRLTEEVCPTILFCQVIEDLTSEDELEFLKCGIFEILKGELYPLNEIVQSESES